MLELTWFKGVVAILGLLAGFVVAVVSLLKANTRVKEAQAKREGAEAEAAKARAKRDEAEAALAEKMLAPRTSIPPEGFDVLTTFRQELGSLRQDIMERIGRLTTRIDVIDQAHDETVKDVSRLQGRLNGHGKKS